MLNVMSVQILFTTAFLAGIAVAFIYRYAPLSNIATSAGAFCNKRYAALPMSRLISNAQNSTATARTKGCFFIGAYKLITASLAILFDRWISYRPTFFRAIFRREGFVQLHLIRLSAYLACFLNLSVHHALHYNTLYSKYGAVILERFFTATGITPELVIE
jgi:hypothetical protein